MKKIIALILAAVMVLALAACGEESSSSSSASGESGGSTSDATGDYSDVSFDDTVVNVAISSDPGTLGPYETNNDGRKQILYSVYETLAFRQDTKGTIKGIIAKDWTQDEDDPLTYYVELYDYVYDSNGNQITADDVIYSFMDVGYDQYVRYCKYIDTIEAADDFNLKIVMTSDTVGAFENLLTYVWVVDEDSYKDSGDDMANNPVGTGPYEVSNYVLGSELTLTARDDYWQTEDLQVLYEYQNAKTINFIVTPELTQQTIGMQTGDFDLLADKLSDETVVDRFSDDDNYLVFSSISNETRTYYFNCTENSPCSDELVRKAICYAIDTEALLEGACGGNGEVATGLGSSEVYSDYDATWGADYYEYNPDKAKELLEEAGYGEGELTIRILASDGDINEGVLNVTQQYLSQVGINMEPLQYENVLAKTYAEDFTMWDIYLAFSGSPDGNVITLWNNTLGNTAWGDANYCGMNDDDLQSRLDLCCSNEGHTSENMTELYDYIFTDNCFCYGLFNPYIYNIAAADVVTEIRSDISYWVHPGSCEYVWNK